MRRATCPFLQEKDFSCRAVSDVPVSFPVLGKKDVLSSSSSAPQDGPAGARRRRRLLNAGTSSAAGARRLAVAAPGSASVSERVATSVVGSGREGVLPGAGSEAVAATGASHEALVSPTRRRASWETISVSEAGSSVASAKAVACASNAGSSCASAGPKAIPTGVSGAKAVTATCHAGSACATAESDAVTALVFSGTGAKAVTFACHTGSETVPVTGFTGSAAAFAELHAVDDLDVGPALTQLLRAVLPGRRAGCEGCGQGCDASVLIQGNGTERTDPANLSLGGFNVIDAAKRLLEVVCPATVSCSDIIVLAARDAVVFTGGPAVPVTLGRRDGLVSLASNVRRNIIDTGFSVDAMASSFTAKGLTLDDLVTLSGGHTIGSAHCNTFRERFQVANGSMTPVDGSMNTDYANELIRACSANGTVAAGTAVDCDAGSASVFDNRYFANLLDGRGLLRTDAVLVQNATTRAKVAEFAQSQDGFFASWAESYARLTNLGVKTGADGEIRRTCSSVNG
nr:unnamed protein product [Digitaria exilis]